MSFTEIQKCFDLWPQRNEDQDHQLYWIFKSCDTSKQSTISRVTTRITIAKLRQILCFTASPPVQKTNKEHRLVHIFRGYMKILENAGLFENKQDSRAYASVQILNIITGLIDSINKKNNELIQVKKIVIPSIGDKFPVRSFSGLFEDGCRQYINALQDCYITITTQLEDAKKDCNGASLCFPERTKGFHCKFLSAEFDESCIDLLTEYRIHETVDQDIKKVSVVTTTLMEIMFCWFEDLAHYYERRVRFCEKNTSTRFATNDWFSIMTFNVNEHKCESLFSAMKYIENSACHVVCTQEDTVPKKSTMYNCLQKCGLSEKDESHSYEVEAIYYLREDTQVQGTVQCVEAVPSATIIGIQNYRPAKRTALIFSYRGLKIANVHLDGGLNVNTLLLSESEEVIKALITFKLELVIKVIETTQPDIIMGDFNSVFITNNEAKKLFLDLENEKVNKKRQEKNINLLDVNIIKKWNCALEDLLAANEYVYAEPSNANEFKYIVDGIWYRSNKIAFIETFIDQIIWKSNRQIPDPCAFSDHDPVLARVYLK